MLFGYDTSDETLRLTTLPALGSLVRAAERELSEGAEPDGFWRLRDEFQAFSSLESLRDLLNLELARIKDDPLYQPSRSFRTQFTIYQDSRIVLCLARMSANESETIETLGSLSSHCMVSPVQGGEIVMQYYTIPDHGRVDPLRLQQPLEISRTFVCEPGEVADIAARRDVVDIRAATDVTLLSLLSAPLFDESWEYDANTLLPTFPVNDDMLLGRRIFYIGAARALHNADTDGVLARIAESDPVSHLREAAKAVRETLAVSKKA